MSRRGPSFPPALTPDLPKVMGHRGAAAVAPENTLASLNRAADLGLTWVEFDVMLTADERPVLFHDESLARTANDQALMAEIELDRVVNLDAGSWFGTDFRGEAVPRLDQALDLVRRRGMQPNVEIKPTKGRDVVTAVRVVEVLTEHWPETPFISSFSRMSLAAVRALRPDWPLGLIARELPRDWQETLRALGCVSIHLEDEVLTEEAVQLPRAAGYQVAVYTVNNAERAKSLLAAGVDCIITDDPECIFEALAETDGPALRDVVG